MKVLATYNIKGGVGKTASAVNLAYLCAKAGFSTLVWDLDPQGAASYYFRIRPRVKGGAKRLIRGKRDLRDSIRGTDFEGLDLLPADFSYRHMDLALEQRKKPTKRLARLIEPLAAEYDYLFLDCPPSISRASESVFVAADALLVPTIPTTLSLRTLDQLEQYLRKNGPKRIRLLPFLCMVDARRALHRSVAAEARNGNARFLESAIPLASVVEQMGTRRAPLIDFAPRSAAARAYADLWVEVRSRMED